MKRIARKHNKPLFLYPDMRKYIPIAAILIVFASLSLCLSISDSAIWWDSAVYLGMGKYLWSNGESGLLEPSRPLVLPFLLGFFWKIGANQALFANILSILFSIGVVFLTYLLGKQMYAEHIGIIAALFVAFSNTFLYFGHRPMTEIPSTFFLLLGLLLFFKNKHFLAGIFLGISFLTRFFQLLFIAAFFIGAFAVIKRRAGLLDMAKGFTAAIIPYALLSWLMYGNLFEPLAAQYVLSMNTGVIYSEHAFFYLIGLLKENFFIVAILALPFFKATKETKVFAMPILLTLLIYSAFSHKEMRVVLVILPLLMIMAVHSTVLVFQYFSKRHKALATIASVILAVLWLALSIANLMPSLSSGSTISTQERSFQAFMAQHEEKEFWISNPKYALFSDAKVSGLLYYPTIAGTPDIALTNSCDFLGNNKAYTEITAGHVKLVENSMRSTSIQTENDCVYRIFEKPTS